MGGSSKRLRSPNNVGVVGETHSMESTVYSGELYSIGASPVRVGSIRYPTAGDAYMSSIYNSRFMYHPSLNVLS